MKKFLLFVVVLAVASISLFAQETQQQPQQPPAGQQGGMPPMPSMQTPGPEMQRAIKETSGRWKYKGTFHKSEMMPNGGTDAGTAVFHPIAGGVAMVQEYRSDGSGAFGKFEGFEVMWYDTTTKKFKTFWCDNMNPMGACMMSTTGNYEGDTLVMTGEMDMMGQKLQMRQTIKSTSPTTFTFNEEVNGKPNMTIEFTKVGDAPHGHDHAAMKDKGTKKK